MTKSMTCNICGTRIHSIDACPVCETPIVEEPEPQPIIWYELRKYTKSSYSSFNTEVAISNDCAKLKEYADLEMAEDFRWSFEGAKFKSSIMERDQRQIYYTIKELDLPVIFVEQVR